MKPLTRIGVTGHRVLAETEKLVPAIDRALETIVARLPAVRFVILSALAEGADRLVVHRALVADRVPACGLVAALPSPREDCLNDFAARESREEFEALVAAAVDVIELTAPGTSREAGYRAVADFILDRSDVLIAIWDGRDPANDVGTAAVVHRARQSGIPLAWVHAGNRDGETLKPASLGAEQGQLTLERF